jgi:hypothetical protein
MVFEFAPVGRDQLIIFSQAGEGSSEMPGSAFRICREGRKGSLPALPRVIGLVVLFMVKPRKVFAPIGR